MFTNNIQCESPSSPAQHTNKLVHTFNTLTPENLMDSEKVIETMELEFPWSRLNDQN